MGKGLEHGECTTEELAPEEAVLGWSVAVTGRVTVSSCQCQCAAANFADVPSLRALPPPLPQRPLSSGSDNNVGFMEEQLCEPQMLPGGPTVLGRVL